MKSFLKSFLKTKQINKLKKTNPTGNHEVAGSIPGLAPWVKDPVLLCELWCRLQRRLGSLVAVAALSFLFLLFTAATRSIWRFPDSGLSPSCSRQPTPQAQQHGILSPLNKARDRTRNLMVPSRIRFHDGNSQKRLVFMELGEAESMGIDG